MQVPNRRRFALIGSAVLLGAGIAVGIWYNRTHQPDFSNVETVKAYAARHIILPASEQPVLATITDPGKVSAPFLKKGHAGDKVLIYAKAKRVIIYRPSVDRLVDVGPIEVSPTSQ